MDPKTVVQQFWTEFEKGDLETTWARWVSADLVIHPSSGYEFNRETWLASEKQLVEAFDDLSVDILDQVAEGDKVATRWSVTGTQRAPFFGVPSAGRTATLTGTTVDRVENGLVIEHWAEVGVPQFLQQLSAGTSPAPAGSAAGTPVDDADHVCLQRLAVELSWRVDAGLGSTIAELFTATGSINTLGEPITGYAALTAWGTMMDTDQNPIAGVRHVLTNLRFVADGPDRAIGTLYITAYRPGGPDGSATLPFVMGLCTDHYRRTPDGWKIDTRTFKPYFMRTPTA